MDEEAPAPHLGLPSWLAGQAIGWPAALRFRRLHLALGTGYTLLYLLVARLL